MGIKLGVVMDPIEGIHYKKDTTLALLWAAQDRGWSLFYMTPDALFLDGVPPMHRKDHVHIPVLVGVAIERGVLPPVRQGHRLALQRGDPRP